MFDKKIIISLVSAVFLYAILLKTTCEDKEYYDRNSMLYAAVVGVFVFLGMRSLTDPGSPAASQATVSENVMTTPFQ
jgi:uncharacterized membrane protein